MTAAPTRRAFLGASAALAAASATAPLRALAAAPRGLHVLKDPNCGCCAAWVEIMAEEGFDVTVENMSNGLLVRRKIGLGIPRAAMSCHTGIIGGYAVEGHVPAADIRRLLAEAPDAVGLAVPGMPYGSPGMGPEEERDAYDVVLVGRDGALTRWSHYPAG